jgi:hypothetical protein
MLRSSFLFILLVLACFGLSAPARAVSPPPDGGYTGANTAEGGPGALSSLTTGTNNTALGSQALFSLTTGIQNTATGAQALKNNIADNNTADGFQALVNNSTGTFNTATGWRALFKNTDGDSSTATGYSALYSNKGNENTANGYNALFSNSTGFNNTAIGSSAIGINTTGIQNTAIGAQALLSTNGDNNTAIGFGALGNMLGNGNIALGSGAGSARSSGDNNIEIGNFGVDGDANTIRIGTLGEQTRTFIAGISGTAVTGTAVVIDGNGQLGVAPSSQRFKTDISSMDKASEAIFALKPVTFRYKREVDPKGLLQFGLIAEEVERVNPDLLASDRDGKPYTVRYEAVNAMLLNEFLKEHRKVEEHEATIAKLKNDLQATAAQQQKQIEALTAGLQKVSAQLEVSGPAPKFVDNKK